MSFPTLLPTLFPAWWPPIPLPPIQQQSHVSTASQNKRKYAKNACEKCKVAHRACSGQRPCQRCKRLGLVCATSSVPPSQRVTLSSNLPPTPTTDQSHSQNATPLSHEITPQTPFSDPQIFNFLDSPDFNFDFDFDFDHLPLTPTPDLLISSSPESHNNDDESSKPTHVVQQQQVVTTFEKSQKDSAHSNAEKVRILELEVARLHSQMKRNEHELLLAEQERAIRLAIHRSGASSKYIVKVTEALRSVGYLDTNCGIMIAFSGGDKLVFVNDAMGHALGRPANTFSLCPRPNMEGIISPETFPHLRSARKTLTERPSLGSVDFPLMVIHKQGHLLSVVVTLMCVDSDVKMGAIALFRNWKAV